MLLLRKMHTHTLDGCMCTKQKQTHLLKHVLWTKWEKGLRPGWLKQVCVCEREMDRESGWYNSRQRKVEKQSYQGRWRDIQLNVIWIDLYPVDAHSLCVRVCLCECVYGIELHTQITVCQLCILSLFNLCMCASVFVYASVWTPRSSFFLLAASIRFTSRLIAEGSASLARPNHSRQSAMSSMSVTHGHHLALSPSSALSLFLSFSNARMKRLWMGFHAFDPWPCHTKSVSWNLFYLIYCIFYLSLIHFFSSLSSICSINWKIAVCPLVCVHWDSWSSNEA